MISRQRPDRGRRALGWPLAAAVAVGFSGCTEQPRDPAPEPPPVVEDEEPAAQLGAEVAAVLPPRTSLAPEVAAAIEDDLHGVAGEYPDQVRLVRTRYPDESVFVRDVAGLSVRDGADLLCVFDAVGRQVVSDLRELHPVSRFCAVTPNDPPEEPEGRVDVVALRVVELGHLLGAAGSELADGEGVALAFGPTELQRGRFLEGLTAALGATPVIELDEELAPAEAITAAVGDGASVVLVGTGPDAAAQTEAALEAGAEVITHQALVRPGDEPALTWNLRWDLALEPAIDRFLGFPDSERLDVGLADGVFEVRAGPGAPPGLEAALAEVEEEILEGQRNPFEVTEPEASEEPEGEGSAEEPPGDDLGDEDADEPAGEGSSEDD